MISGVNNDINGLVLAGGKSTRMGQDKGLTDWHGKPQRYFLADLLMGVCDKVYISCREDQVNGIEAGYHPLVDNYSGIGPTGGILTAMEAHPDVAWLVVACDLPLMNTITLQYLVANRNPNTIATTFQSPHDGLPEPLVTIWEKKSYPLLLEKMNEGQKCPRKVLINNDITLLTAPDPEALLNTNTPGDAELAATILHRKTEQI